MNTIMRSSSQPTAGLCGVAGCGGGDDIMPVYVFDAPSWYAVAVGLFACLLIVAGIWEVFRGDR